MNPYKSQLRVVCGRLQLGQPRNLLMLSKVLTMSYWFFRLMKVEVFRVLQLWRESLIPILNKSSLLVMKNLPFNLQITSRSNGLYSATYYSIILSTYLQTQWMNSYQLSNLRMAKSFHSRLAIIFVTSFIIAPIRRRCLTWIRLFHQLRFLWTWKISTMSLK